MSYLSPEVASSLMDQARKASEKTYSPYSHFAVGAAILAADNSVFTGTNIENASFGLTICAERTAIGNARMAGAGEIKAVAVWSHGDSLSPCGACRQFILEFGTGIIIVFLEKGAIIQRTIAEMLPFAFTEQELK